METTTKQAFSEVYDIINHLDNEIKVKIPNGFVNLIKNNMDINYKIDIDYSKSIVNQNLLHETKILLSLIYRDYICDEKKRKELLELDSIAIKEHEKNLRQQYEINFEQRKNIKRQTENIATQYNSLIDIKNLKWYEKLFNILKNFFKHK